MKEFQLTKVQRRRINARIAKKIHTKAEGIAVRRTQHVEWCKQKALTEINAGNPEAALTSFCHNMKSNALTAVHIALLLIPELRATARLDTPDQIAEFIAGFN